MKTQSTKMKSASKIFKRDHLQFLIRVFFFLFVFINSSTFAFGQCITITSVTSPNPTVTPMLVDVKGTITGCDSVIVKFTCDFYHIEITNHVAATAGFWMTEFSDRCACGKPITITATSNCEPNCAPAVSTITIPCIDINCPYFSVNITAGICMGPNGDPDDNTSTANLRDYIFTPTKLFTAAVPITLHWDFHDGKTKDVTKTTDFTKPVHHRFASIPSAMPVLTVVAAPSSSGPCIQNIILDITPFTSCSKGCTGITISDINVSSVCDAGVWKTIFNAVISGTIPGAPSYQWSVLNTDGTTTSYVTSSPSLTANFSCFIPNSITLTVMGTGCSPDPILTKSINKTLFPPCSGGCPEFNISASAPDPSHPCNYTFSVDVTSTGCGSSISGYNWKISGNSTSGFTGAMLSGNPASYTFTKDGSYVVELTLAGVTDDSGNPCKKETGLVVNCSGGSPSPTGGPTPTPVPGEGGICTGSLLCCLLWILLMASIVSALIALCFVLCVGDALSWTAFLVSVGILIATSVVLGSFCDFNLCNILLSMALSGGTAFAIICGTTAVPCSSWLCDKTTIPILGIGVSNILIADLFFWLLWFLVCILFK